MEDINVDVLNWAKERADTKVINEYGRTYAVLHRVGGGTVLQEIEQRDYRPTAIEVRTLTAFVDYINNNVEAFQEDSIVHIKSPWNVEFISPFDEICERNSYISASYAKEPLYLIDMDNELLVLILLSRFDKTKDREKVLSFAGSIVEEECRLNEDDGVTQTVTVRKTSGSRAEEALPNPVLLKPFRTFYEIEQPTSQYVFRMAKGPVFKLEVVTDDWQNRAVLGIKDYLRKNITNKEINILA